MSKRLKRTKLLIANDFDYGASYSHDGDMYVAPRGKKPRGRDKRKSGNHKTAYYD